MADRDADVEPRELPFDAPAGLIGTATTITTMKTIRDVTATKHRRPRPSVARCAWLPAARDRPLSDHCSWASAACSPFAPTKTGCGRSGSRPTTRRLRPLPTSPAAAVRVSLAPTDVESRSTSAGSPSRPVASRVDGHAIGETMTEHRLAFAFKGLTPRQFAKPRRGSTGSSRARPRTEPSTRSLRNPTHRPTGRTTR